MKKLFAALGALALVLALVGPVTAVASSPVTIVAWNMPSYVNSTTAVWPQTLAFTGTSLTADLHLLDADLLCGQAYQIDAYNTSATTTALIAGGFLNGSNNPTEDLVPGGWGTAYRVVQTDACPAPPPAVSTAAPICTTMEPPGFIEVTFTGGTAQNVVVTIGTDTLSQAPGDFPLDIGSYVAGAYSVTVTQGSVLVLDTTVEVSDCAPEVPPSESPSPSPSLSPSPSPVVTSPPCTPQNGCTFSTPEPSPSPSSTPAPSPTSTPTPIVTPTPTPLPTPVAVAPKPKVTPPPTSTSDGTYVQAPFTLGTWILALLVAFLLLFAVLTVYRRNE